MIGSRTRDWYDRSNRLLLGHIATQASKGVHYCGERNRTGEQSANIPNRETQELTAPLIRLKNEWAAEMASADLGDGVDPERQRTTWAENMVAAECEAQVIRDRYAQLMQSRRAA